MRLPGLPFFLVAIGLMHDRGGLERLAWLLVGQLGGGQLTQFLVDERQQLVGGGWVAGFGLRQDMCDITHEVQDTLVA